MEEKVICKDTPAADTETEALAPTDTEIQEAPPSAAAKREVSSAPREPLTEEATGAEEADVDYERLAREDLDEIKRLIPAYGDAEHLGELPFARRFAELRDLGLSVKEALAALHPRFERDTGKSHLRPSVRAGRARAQGVMSAEEMSAARLLFADLGEKEIHALYRRVARK